ncbi:curli polymerization inhibitor CsgI-related protein [Aggregatibacter actinomycetemcomitans]|uniref:curli polymerization inhibitor CsgI-related protein n=1 Tax=Aggregatibacter actinomycetemcomitans TaxID=714 RepID=UPI0006A6FF68|nr:DUF2057 domain-containing protein [Aggregatibacter actinomycetemcomitans]KOE66199.1 hypothetical protein SCC393_0305720 [Aggregatibacter actinomycetemcomitans serotype e str. SCC393]
MKFRLAALAATLLASTASFAGMITSSSNIDFLAFDGQKPSKSLLKEARSFNINDTQKHQVVVRVSEIIKTDSDSALLETDPIVVTFQGSIQDIIISAPKLSNERDFNAFKKAPVISVKTASGANIQTQQEYLKQEGFFPTVSLIKDLGEYNASGAAAAVPAFATATASTAAQTAAVVAGGAATGKVAKGKVTLQGENVAEQMLQYWYQQADKETQTRFINWVKKQK